MKPVAAIFGLCAMLACPAVAAGAGTPVDLQLILAIDSSASIDDREFALQMAGIAAAFRDPEVIAAIGSGPHARIAVAAVFWAESGWRKDVTPWQVLAGAPGAEAFARYMERHPRRIAGGTGIGSAILFSAQLFDGNGFSSPRKVIDISGDGRETTFREWRVTPGLARAAANARGVTINGLAMLSDEPDLGDYYDSEVIGGAGSFVVTAETIDDFARAIRRKLIREIEYQPIVSRVATPD
ncbi:MAG: DUF1194 domain-containing protein [Alphaproteobacteria bacterium]